MPILQFGGAIMTYRRYFDDNDQQGQRQFFDSIAGQVTTRTMSADDKGLFVEYEISHQDRLIRISDVYGDSWTVSQADLDSNKTMIPLRFKTGRKFSDMPKGLSRHKFTSIHRENIVESDTGHIEGTWLLPMAIVSVALYAVWFMASRGVFQALTVLQK